MVTNIGGVDFSMVIIRASVYLDNVENHESGPKSEDIETVRNGKYIINRVPMIRAVEASSQTTSVWLCTELHSMVGIGVRSSLRQLGTLQC